MIRQPDQAIQDLEGARKALFRVLRSLEGAERQEGIRKALKVVGATELAKGLGVSRARIYQLRDGTTSLGGSEGPSS